MKHSFYDYIILGGGCASLSLAMNLVKKNVNSKSFLIIEKRASYTDDRSWCFWEKNSTKYQDMISRSWEKWCFSKKRIYNYQENQGYSYHYIRSLNFYNKAIKVIRNSPNIKIKLGESVLKVKNKNKLIVIETNKSKYLAEKVLDTRPQKGFFLDQPLIYQSFLGYELKLNKLNNIKKIAHIMDDMRILNGNFIFDYILPISKNKILFETTFFSNLSVSKNLIKVELLKKIRENNFKEYLILREEYGVIPMGFIKKIKEKKNNYFYAGTSAGAIRASSGYGFLRIQDWAEKCSYNIKKNDNLITHPKEKKILYFMDKFFIRILLKNTTLGPDIFFHFFSRVSPEIFIKFMNGKTNILENIKVILSMPSKIFLDFLIRRKK